MDTSLDEKVMGIKEKTELEIGTFIYSIENIISIFFSTIILIYACVCNIFMV